MANGKKYFLVRTNDNALQAFVGYSIEVALKAMKIEIDDVKAWDFRPASSLPYGKSPVFFLLEGV